MKQHNLRMSDELFAAVNEAAGDVPRNTWIVRALERALAIGLSHPDIERERIANAAQAKRGVAPRPKAGKR